MDRHRIGMTGVGSSGEGFIAAATHQDKAHCSGEEEMEDAPHAFSLRQFVGQWVSFGHRRA